MNHLTDREKDLVKYKKLYLELVYRITRLQLSGENPPEKLLKKAHEVAQAAEIPKAFLKTLKL